MSLLKEIQRQTGMTRSEILGLLPTSQRRYKVYQIPKRNGGMRLIAQPAREVKTLQYALMRCFLNGFDVHPCATAYRKGGIGLLANAAPHAGSCSILKMDFQNFFNSIRQEDFADYLRGGRPDLAPDEIEMIGQICFWRSARSESPVLSVGAPSSPIISNILMFSFDVRMGEISDHYGATYTRYADDLTLSHQSAGELWKLHADVANLVQLWKRPKLSLNAAKTKVFSPKNKRAVTGLILDNRGGVSLGKGSQANDLGRDP